MRVVVAQTSFLGDVVLSTPVFTAVKQQLTDAHVTAWVRPEGAAVLVGHPHVDQVLVDDKRGADHGLSGFVRQCDRLREGRFDVAVALHKSLRTAVLLALARVPRRIGFRPSAGWFLYHERVTRDAALHDVRRNLSILAPLGINVQRHQPVLSLAVTAEAEAGVATLLQEIGISAGASLVALAPGSAWTTKRWTVEGYAEVAVALHRDGHHVLLLGSPVEHAIADEVNRRAGGTAINLAGRTDVPMLTGLIDRCQLLVCNDSAPMHIAVARGVAVVAVFGPTDPRQGYGPFSERAIVVQRDLDCRPCGRHGGERCPIQTHECMRAIQPAVVLAAARKLLQLPPAVVSRLVAP